jgi:hypothetical protein
MRERETQELLKMGTLALDKKKSKQLGKVREKCMASGNSSGGSCLLSPGAQLGKVTDFFRNQPHFSTDLS